MDTQIQLSGRNDHLGEGIQEWAKQKLWKAAFKNVWNLWIL